MIRFHRAGKVLQALCLLILAASRVAEAQPPAKYTYWILAEGAANDFFDEDIVIGNPNAGAARVKITLLPENAEPIDVPDITIGASSRHTFSVRGSLPAGGASVSAVVTSLPPAEGQSPQPIVVERTMTWAHGQRRGGHNSPGLLSTAPTWYLAEGTTGLFNTYILITNPDPNQDAQVQVRFLRELSGPLTYTLVVPKNGRRTIDANGKFDLDHDGTGETDITEPFSTVVTSTNNVNIAVERAMYWNGFEGGHESTAVTAPHKTWLFAEGNTGGDASFSWDTYLLLANPQASANPVTLTFFRQGGTPVVYNTTLPPNSRTTVNVRDIDANNDGVKELTSASFSAKVEAQQEIIAERAMYWSSNGIVYIEGHNTPGVNAEALKWAFADGMEGSIDATGVRFSSFFLVSNSSASPLNIKARFVREDGKGLIKEFSIPAQSRFTIPTGTYPELSHQRFSAFIESTNNTPFVAERAIYWGPGFYGGTASVGTPWDAAIADPPALVLSPIVNTVSPGSGLTTGGTEVTITGSNFVENLTGPNSGTRVKFGTLNATSVTIVSDTKLIATTPPVASPGPVSLTVSNAHLNPAWLDATLANGFTYNPAEPTLQTDHTLAFGDSITLGITKGWCDMGGGTMMWCDAPNDPGYPSRLATLLKARYPKQQTDITVLNSGISGECVSRSGCTGKSGGRRLLDQLESGSDQSDLVVILEGVNDLNNGVLTSEIILMLESMVNAAKSQGKKVILSSLTPVKAPLDHINEHPVFWKADPSKVAELNAAIDGLSVKLNVPRVNMFAAFGSGPGAMDCNFNASCRALLSPDGLHPSAAGYARMAEVINAKIVEQFEAR
jgi:lysophospholipase L1-like esterase